MSLPNIPNNEEVDPKIQYAINSKMTYNTGPVDNDQYEFFNTAEFRALNAQFADPLTINAKVMIDYEKPYGLFAKEHNTDSALAYLKRIGDTVRYSALKRWIKIFQTLIRHFDFLILGVDGLDTIVNIKPQDKFTDNDRITVHIRETSDMMIQSLLTTYRNIWFDNERGVEVLPANLRRFDMWFLLYSAGYYNMMLYDVLEANGLSENNVETQMYPTLKKLSNDFFEKGKFSFNHHLVIAEDASINNEESGKSFFSTVSNEMNGDFIKNSMVFNFRFGSYNGKFYNLYGDFDLNKSLAINAAHSKFSNLMWSQFGVDDSELATMQLMEDEETQGNRFLKSIGTVGKKYLNAAFGPNTPVGNIFKDATSLNTYTDAAKNVGQLMLQHAENKYVYDNIAKMNNMVMSNFSDIYGLYTTIFGEKIKNIEYQVNPNPVMEMFPNIENNNFLVADKNQPKTNTEIDETSKLNQIVEVKNIRYGQENIYNRQNF